MNFVYEELIPAGELSRFIDKLWYVKLTPLHKKEKILPLARMQFIINLGETYKLFTKDDLSEHIEFQDSFISGLQERFLVIENPEHIENIGVEFKPFGLSQFLDFDVERFTNKVVSAEDFFNTSVIKNRIQETQDVQSKLELLEEFIGGFLRTPDKKFEEAEKIYGILNENPDTSLGKVSALLGFTEKHIIDINKKFTGVTVGFLADVIQFRKVVDKIDMKKPSSWSEFAAEQGFYDQPHFIKRFKSFTGFTPSEYIDMVNKYASFPSFVALDKR